MAVTALAELKNALAAAMSRVSLSITSPSAPERSSIVYRKTVRARFASTWEARL